VTDFYLFTVLFPHKSKTRLGAGAFGTVFKFYDQSSRSYRACKEVDLDGNMVLAVLLYVEKPCTMLL